MQDYSSLFAITEALARKTEFRFTAERLAYMKMIEFTGNFAEYASLLIQRELDHERNLEDELNDRVTS